VVVPWDTRNREEKEMRGKHEAPAGIPHRRRSVDGVPYLTYFKDTICFEWTGKATDPIEVSPYAQGEPIEYVIYRDPHTDLGLWSSQMLSGLSVVDFFQSVCDEWLEQATGPSTYEGMRVLEVYA